MKCTHSNWSNTSLQSSGKKIGTPKIRPIKNGWHIDVNARFVPNINAIMLTMHPKKKNRWFDSPMQASSQMLWWSRFTIQAWQMLQWNVRGGVYLWHLEHIFGLASLSSDSPSSFIKSVVCSSVMSGKLSSSLVLCTTWFNGAFSFTWKCIVQLLHSKW